MAGLPITEVLTSQTMVGNVEDLHTIAIPSCSTTIASGGGGITDTTMPTAINLSLKETATSAPSYGSNIISSNMLGTSH